MIFLEHDWIIFPETVGNFIIPTDSYVSEGLKPPTSERMIDGLELFLELDVSTIGDQCDNLELSYDFRKLVSQEFKT